MKRGLLLKSRRAFDMPFSWIFAIIAGGVILFLAIYAAVNFIGVAKYRQYTEAAKSITIMVDPLETGIASAVGDVVGFRQETRTYYNCYAPTSAEPFGKQTIAFSEESGLGEKWAEQGGEISIRNKFIFAGKMEQGKNLYLFSKPFYMGFKVNDLIFATAKDYCFVAPPDLISDEIEQMSVLKNIKINNSIEECAEQSVVVCFGDTSDSRCDIAVNGGNDESFSVGYVLKNGEQIVYVGPLLYGAIFAEPEIYECNIKRLGAKISELAMVYKDKIELVKVKGCDSVIAPYLDSIALASSAIDASSKLGEIYQFAQQMDDENEVAECKIYSGEDY